MLGSSAFVGFLPITDTAVAIAFYCDLLGLPLEHLDGFALVVDAGVELERFPGMDQDADGVWRAPGGDAIVWFRDPDGNRLSLSQAGPSM